MRSSALRSWPRPPCSRSAPAKRKSAAGLPIAISERGDDLLRAVVAGLPDPVVALDRDGRVLALNERARALAPALRQGEPVSFALRMPELIEAIGRAAAQGEEQRVVYFERVPLDRWFETIVMPVKREPNATRPDLVLMTFHDLTPLRRVEEMRADFVANASHELRTPLAALLGFIETLQGSARDDAKARERFLAIMQEQARRMARLIDDLLSLSRIELNAHRRPDTPVDLVPIVRQVVDGLGNAGARPRRDRQYRGGECADGARRPRRTGSRVRESGRERAQIRRRRQARRYQARVRVPRPTASPKRR